MSSPKEMDVGRLAEPSSADLLFVQDKHMKKIELAYDSQSVRSRCKIKQIRGTKWR
jgi:hypothetical protein